MPSQPAIQSTGSYPWRQSQSVIRIVLPSYNEADNLAPLIEGIDSDFHHSQAHYELMIIDDGSTDETAAVVARYYDMLPIVYQRHEQNQGLGATIRDGLIAAAERSDPHDIIVVMDADNSHRPGLVRTMVRVLREGSDVVIASRYKPESIQLGVPFFRRLLSRGASLLLRLAFPTTGVKDYTCGFRAYRAALIKQAINNYGKQFVRQDGFQCMLELLLQLRSMNAIFREVPMVLRYDQKQGASKMKVLKTIIATLRFITLRFPTQFRT